MNLIAAVAHAALTAARRGEILLLLGFCFLSLSFRQAPAATSPIRVPRDFTTIQAAIDAAQPGQEVWVNQGTYPEQLIMKSQVGLYGGFTGSETQRGQRDPQAHPTILKPTIKTNAPADDLKAGKIVTMDGLSSATLDGFTITIAPTTVDYHYGKLTDLYAIYANNLDASNLIANCSLSNFKIFCSEPYVSILSLLYFSNSAAKVNNCLIENNQSNNPHLFGALLTRNSSPVFTGCRFDKNIAVSEWGDVAVGVAVYDDMGEKNYFSPSSPVFEKCIFSENQNAAIVLSSGLIKRCKMINNAKVGLIIEGSVRVEDTLISGNQVGVRMQSSDATFTNCIITGNSGDFYAGAFDLSNGSKNKLNIMNCTIAGNHGARASAINIPTYYTSELRLINSIISGDDGPAINVEYIDGISGKISNCVFDGFLKGVYCDNQIGTMTTVGMMDRLTTWTQNNIQGAVRFMNAAGGDYQLNNGSVALDRGQAEDAPPIDFDGRARPGDDGKVDIGAFEASSDFTPSGLTLPPGSYVDQLPLVSTISTVPLSFVAWDNDGASGQVSSVALYYRRNGGAWRQYGNFSPTAAITFDSRLAAGDGYYEFYTLATDGDGRRETAPIAPDAHIVIDAAHARTRVYVRPEASGLLSGTDWTNAVRTLSDGIAMARALNAKEIWVARGDYHIESIEMWNDLKLYGGFAGNESSISARHIADNPTTIDNAIRIPGTRNNMVDGFILLYSDYNTIDAQAPVGKFTISNCQLMKNGMRLTKGIAQVTSCTINAGISVSSSTLTVMDCTFNCSQAINGEASTLNLSNTTFSNGLGSGGALFCNDCNVRMTGCTIQHCRVGIVREKVLSMTDALKIKKEHLPFPPIPYPHTIGMPTGAGIFAEKSKLRLENCVVVDNRAGDPQIVWGVSIVTNPVGGAIYVIQKSTLDCVHCTFVNNRIYNTWVHYESDSNTGGAIYASSDSTLNLYNTIFSGNNRSAVSATNLSLNYCLFHDNPDGDTTGTISRSVKVIHGDPMFVNAAAGNFRLKPSSPAIDAGMKAGSPIVDMDGQPRGVKGTTASRGDGSCYDIGAYEYQPAPVTIRVIYPNGGEKLRAGSKFAVAWWANGGSAEQGVRLELWNTKGKVAALGTASNPMGYGTVTFTLPGTLAGSDFRIRAQSLAQSSLVDLSDKQFTILVQNSVPSANWRTYE